MKSLVTGIAGFTGSYLSEALVKRGGSVVGISQSNAVIENVERVHAVDITDLAAMKSVVRTERPEFVVHLAGVSSVVHDNVDEIYRTNVMGTRNLLESLTALAEPPQCVILASSANIYGNAREGVLEESLPPAPANDYGVAKIAMEYVAALYGTRLPVIITRPFNYTGRGQSSDFIVPKIVSHARDRSSVIELGNLDVERDFSDVRTVVDVYARLLAEPKAIGGTFNICSGSPVSLRQILDLVAEITGHRMDVRVNPAFVRANEVRTLSGSAARLKRVIGPLTSIPLKETLRWMLEG